MPIVLEATVYLTILILKCKPKAETIKTHLVSKNLNLKIQSLLHHVTSRCSWLKKKTRRKKDPKDIRENALGTERNNSRPLASILRPQKRGSGLYSITIVTKTIIQMITPNF